MKDKLFFRIVEKYVLLQIHLQVFFQIKLMFQQKQKQRKCYKHVVKKTEMLFSHLLLVEANKIIILGDMVTEQY